MLRSIRPSGVLAVVLAVSALTALTLPATASTRPEAATAVKAAAAPAKHKTNKPTSFTPIGNVLFNNANAGAAKRDVLIHKIIRTINATPKGSTIHLATWSYFDRPVTTALINAHRRGVSVRLVMSSEQAKASASYRRLRRALQHYGNDRRTPEMKSYAKTCKGACRGKAGTMHAKLYLFSQAGKATDVVMWGSPNLTSASERIQWNDLFTSTTRPKLYAYAESIFEQLWKEKTVDQPYAVEPFGHVAFSMLPYHGTDDWVTNTLKTVKCHGATGGTGVGGKTSILVAQAVIRGKVGDRIAHQLKRLYNDGCPMKILYSIRGVSTRKILESSSGRGAVPMRHYVQDTNGDGVFDKYLHMKVLAISGVVGANTATTMVEDGSPNWADMSVHNDEVVGYFYTAHIRAEYASWINYLWNHVPVSATYNSYARLAGPINPNAKISLG